MTISTTKDPVDSIAASLSTTSSSSAGTSATAGTAASSSSSSSSSAASVTSSIIDPLLLLFPSLPLTYIDSVCNSTSMTDDDDDKIIVSPRPKADVKGVIRGEQMEAGGIAGLTGVGSFDTSEKNEYDEADDDDDDDDDDDAMLNDVSNSSNRPRLYSEEDEEIRMAKAMAMAINNNPNLTPSDARQQILKQFNKKDETEQLSPAKNNATPPPAPKKELPHIQLNPFANLQESMKKTREMASERFHEIVQGGSKPSDTATTTTNSSSKNNNSSKNKPESLQAGTTTSAKSSPTAAAAAAMKKAAAPSTAKISNKVDGPAGVPTPKPSTATTTTKKSPVLAKETIKKQPIAVAPPSPSKSTATANSKVLPNLHSITQSLVQTVDAETTRKLTKASVGFSSMVWKRRSGLGKYQGKNAWERRKLVIRGNNFVAYYKVDGTKEEATLGSSMSMMDSGTDLSAAPSNSMDDDESVVTSTSSVATAAAATTTKHSKPSWLEQAAINLANKANMNSFIPATSSSTSTTATSGNDTPRGALDLAKERATVAASIGHSGSPTPFCLSIKVRGETRWKLCFDTHDLQMQWLAALTDLVVTCSVDLYNEKLLAKADPRSHSDAAVVYPPSSATATTTSSGGQLWEMSKYEVRSFLGALPSQQSATKGDEDDLNPIIPDEEEVEDSDDEEEEEETGDDESTLMQDRDVMPTGRDYEPDDGDSDGEDANSKNKKKEGLWVLRGRDLYLAAAIVNSALLFSHAGSTGPNRFWHIATFANLGLWYLLSKQQQQLDDSSPPKSSKKDETRSIVPAKKSRRVKIVKKKKGIESGPAPPPPVSPSSSLVDKPDKKQKKDDGVFIPRAGSTAIQVKEPKDSAVKDGQTFAKWRPQPGNILQVRSHGYKSTKKKVASPGSIYDCVNVDIFESASRYPDMAKRVILPKVTFVNDDGPKTWNAPDIFIISLSFPTEAPSSMFAPAADDGVGYTICMYFAMRQDTRDILRRVTADDYDPQVDKLEGAAIQRSKVNAVKLFERWVKRAPNDPEYFARFKFVPQMQNVKEAGLPSWMAAYNGKPVLIKRNGKTGFFYQHPELSTMEFDVSLHPFPYVAKQGFSYLYQNIFKDLVAVFGFVIESRDDDELPECLIGLTEVCYPDPKDCQNGAKVFAGTSHKSNTTEVE